MNAILVALAVFGAVDAAAKPRQVRIDLVICEGDTLGNRADGTIKSLAEPTLTTLGGQRATFVTGYKFLSRLNADSVRQAWPDGVRVEVSPRLLSDGRVLVDLSATRTKSAPGGGTEHNAKLTRLAEQGKPFRHRIAADSPESQTWVEVTVTEVKR